MPISGLIIPIKLFNGGQGVRINSFMLEGLLRGSSNIFFASRACERFFRYHKSYLKFLFERKLISSVYLRPTRNARSDGMALTFFFGIKVQVVHQQGSGSHQGHFSFDYIDQLRQLIQGILAKDFSHRCQAVLLSEIFVFPWSYIVQCTEFDEVKRALVESWALLDKKDSFLAEEKQKRDDEKYGGQDDQSN